MLEKTAYGLGRNDEEPNIRLAVQLCVTRDQKGIREIAAGLRHPKRRIANDCIKVLYEIGAREPELIAGYVSDFLCLLRSPNNRLVWGAMTALAKIAFLKPAEIFKELDLVLKANETGSVITVDNSISVLAELCRAGKCYEKRVFPIILKHLESCRPKEIGQHAERAFVAVHAENRGAFLAVLRNRQDHVRTSQKRRIEKLIKKTLQDASRIKK